jgi:hypothetical protein
MFLSKWLETDGETDCPRNIHEQFFEDIYLFEKKAQDTVDLLRNPEKARKGAKGHSLQYGSVRYARRKVHQESIC